MSLFKKSNRKFKQRSRRESDDDDDDASNTIKIDTKEEDDQESTTKTIELKNVKLSFADDNDDNNQEFKLKRSSSSLRALKQLSKKSKELKKSTKQNEFANQSLNQTKSVRKYMETNKLENKDDNQIEFNQQSKIINLDDDELIEDDDDNEVDDYLKFKKPSFKKDILIPDNKVIEEFKRRRLLAKEYISLNSTSPLNNFNDNDNKNSRLIREDPNDKEEIGIDDDDNEDLDDDRVNFYTDKTNLQKEKIKEAFFNAQNEDNQIDNRFKFNDKSSDDELDLWEQSQIKKGVGLQQQKEFTTNEIGNLLFNNQRNQLNNFEPPSFIKSMRPALKKDKLLDKYKEELHLVNNKLDYLYNQFNNIELTINNLKETLDDN